MKSRNTITQWMNPSEMLPSEYGMVTCREWCEKEVERINRTGGRKASIAEKDGMVAVVRE